MQVQLLPLYNFLEGTGKSFVIPVYQRDYTWTKVNCQKLWEDLVDLNNNNNRNNHFLGTLVTISKGFEEYTVIDGQQRLTTVSILLIALHRYLKNKEGINKEEERLMNILLDFLIDTHSLEQDKRIRLKPNKQDKEHFENLFTGNTSNINSNIVNNYDFFLNTSNSVQVTTGQIYESFKKLTMVLITLDRGQDEPQLIFESLNSTGVDLTAGDLVRNYILMDLEPFEQERMYKNYWVKIENLTGDIAEFVRNYLMFKLKVWVKKADAYPVFKNFSIVQYNKNKESILQDLLSFAEIFSWFVQIKKHQNNNINRQLARLKRLEFTVCYPYLFDVFNDVKSGNIDEETAKNVLVLIESYAFRKIIVDNTTQGLNKLFISLGKDIKKGVPR